jgi:hypothetical protein
MLAQLLAIARNAFVESLRQPVVFVLIVLCGILQVFSTWTSAFAMSLTEVGEVEGDNKMMLDVGMSTIFGVSMLMAAFVATAVMSREIENKTALMVAAKPIGRPVIVVGKYLGLAGALMVATVPMLVFLLMGIRHGVMSTAGDELDGPVLLFSGLAVAGAVLIAGWTNFYYGWSFPQTATVLLAAGFTAAYLGVLMISKKWEFQQPGHDFKPQITMACAGLFMAVLVLSAVATAASTRLGQVMTIVVCAGVFMASLLSNHLIGRRAFDNEAVARIASVTPLDPTRAAFSEPGVSIRLDFQHAPTAPIRPGSTVWYGPSPSGFPLSVSGLRPFAGSSVEPEALNDASAGPALVVTEASDTGVTVRSVGAVRAALPPRSEDYLFLTPTRTNALALAAWSAVPNMHAFWLLDPVSQAVKIPFMHLVLIAGYALAQIAACLSVAVILFQKRDLG